MHTAMQAYRTNYLMPWLRLIFDFHIHPSTTGMIVLSTPIPSPSDNATLLRSM
jgi:hypothetical protein